MKAHYLTSKEAALVKKTAATAAARLLAKQQEDIAKRAQYCMLVAMLDARLSPRTINRVIRCLEPVKERYGYYKEEECADFAFCRALQERGINVEMTEHENV